MAEMRRGCATTTEQASPCSAASSSTNWGTCVVLPQPVSPSTTTTRLPWIAARMRVRNSNAGSDSRCARKGDPFAGGGGPAALASSPPARFGRFLGARSRHSASGTTWWPSSSSRPSK